MSSDTPRFWPNNPGHQPEGSQPESVLRDAAAELGRVTDHEIHAELRTRVVGTFLEHEFYLVSENIEYRYLLFRARHELGFPVRLFDYPVNTDLDADLSIDLDFDSSDEPSNVPTECATSEQLEQRLKQLFELPATQQIVGQLRNLSREAI